jgi:membrane fusion protein, multidrug efflux system
MHPAAPSTDRLRVVAFRSLLVSAALSFLAGCGHSSPPTTAAAAKVLDNVVVQPARAPLERRLDGIVEAVNQGTVAAQTSGRVEAIFYDVNDFVPAGAVIVRLRATEQRAGLLQAEAALREATARETEAQTHFQRISDMYERKMVAKSMLDEATATRDAAQARLAAARAQLQSAREGVAYTEIRAPYAGIVTRRHVEVGETVSPGTQIMSGLSLQYLRVAVDVPQSIVDQIRRIKKGAVYVNGRRVVATKLTVFPEATGPSNTFRARLELPENAADLYPGTFVKVGFVVGESERLLVPQRALVERSEVTAVYVLNADGRVSLRQIRSGHRFEDQLEVLSGLTAGERVALDPVSAMQRLSAPAER